MGAPTVGTLATPGKRILARIVDALVMIIVLVPVLVIYSFTVASTTTSSEFGGNDFNSEFSSTELGIGIGSQLGLSFALMLIPAIYEIAFIATKGATPGKMLMKVRVVRETDGQIPGWGPSFMRWLPNLANLCCSLVGLVLLIWSLVNLFANDRRQTPFDLAAHTLVIDVS